MRPVSDLHPLLLLPFVGRLPRLDPSPAQPASASHSYQPPPSGPPQKLAAKHFNTKFLRVDVANVPFLVVKLEIKVLPCVIAFIDGVTKDK